MRAFLSPSETRLLRMLAPGEREVVLALYEELDVVLVETADGDGQERLFGDVAA